MNDPAAAVRTRAIRSFVLRAGRIGPGQQRALDELGPRFVLPYRAEPLDFAATFGRDAPTVLEIGFGMGDATAQIAAALPDTNFIGIEVHAPGVGALLKRIGEQGLGNLRLIQHDAVEVLEHMIAPGSLAGVHIYFPDPWHKKRHHKRRLVQSAWVQQLATRLAPGGYLHCATDWQPYAEQMLEVLGAEPSLVNSAEAYAPRPAWRPLTKFEQRGLKLGHGVWDLLFTRRWDEHAAIQHLLSSIDQLLGSHWKGSGPAAGESPARLSRAYRCRCGGHVFFRNSLCLKCDRPLGFLPLDAMLRPLSPGPQPDSWVADGHEGLFAFCANREQAPGCNWLHAADDANPLCIACRLNRTIPNQDDTQNVRYWALIEQAKRRMVAELLALQLPVKSTLDEDPQHGLMFDSLRVEPGGARVLTGHADGLITLNVEEADDARREQLRLELHEPYRTLLGHLRHEVGHYYWDRLVRDGPWLEPYRALFGDERTDYAAALQAHYEHGPQPDWALHHISSYASTHPWEDWAETWAHYLHMVDSLGTALGFGLSAEALDSAIEPFGPDALHDPDDADAGHFLALHNAWLEMTMVLNELARSMGQPDFYPFVMSAPVVEKLQFVHLVVRGARASD